jgi:hypothetical protein
LKTHAFIVTAISGAIYLAGGDCLRLSKDIVLLALMAQRVYEGFAAVRTLGMPATPLPLRALFTWLPRALAVFYRRRFFASEMADYVFGQHVRLASFEMREVAATANSCWSKAASRLRRSRNFTARSTISQAVAARA